MKKKSQAITKRREPKSPPVMSGNKQSLALVNGRNVWKMLGVLLLEGVGIFAVYYFGVDQWTLGGLIVTLAVIFTGWTVVEIVILLFEGMAFTDEGIRIGKNERFVAIDLRWQSIASVALYDKEHRPIETPRKYYRDVCIGFTMKSGQIHYRKPSDFSEAKWERLQAIVASHIE